MTKSTAPIACSLSDKEFRFRRKAAREELLAHLQEASKTAEGVVLTFGKTQAIQTTIEKFVELERQCCSFLTLDTVSREECIEVSIAAGAEGAEAVQAIFASMSPQSSVAKGLLRGGFTAIAVGGFALLLCCMPLIFGGIGLTVLSTSMLAFKPSFWVEVIGVAGVLFGVAMVYIAVKRRSQKSPSQCC